MLRESVWLARTIRGRGNENRGWGESTDQIASAPPHQPRPSRHDPRRPRTALGAERDQAAISAFSEAIRLDARYAQAFAERSIAYTEYAEWDASGAEVHECFVKALADARSAVALAPGLAEGHFALATALTQGFLDFSAGNAEYERARDLAPGSARILAAYSRNAAEMGNTVAGIDAARRAILLDPLNFTVHRTVGIAFLMARQYADAIAAYQAVLSLNPGDPRLYALIGATRYEMGDLQAARASCEKASADDVGQYCLALTYQRLGMRSEAAGILRKVQSSRGDPRAYDVAAIYAQWGDIPKALDSLETALRLRDPDLSDLKTDPDLDPLRGEPRFQAIARALKFPE
jgi:tetratricopeptide (TPR) repeat protein